ncbi:hypothetical protein BGZ90_009155 [Linnemannia elongata]|nr:hypothetical protein BGZ90_009155 [Linnemannia elongata]
MNKTVQRIKANRAKSNHENQAEAELQEARKSADTAFMNWMQEDEDLQIERATRYALQRSKTKASTDPPPMIRHAYKARPTWANPTVEAKAETLYFDCVLDAANELKT